MAIIGKIRERSGLVIIVIGIAMLGFVATELISNSLFRTDTMPQGVGKVYGESIPQEEYDLEYNLSREAMLSQMGPGAQLTAAQDIQTKNETWSRLVMQKIMEKEYADLGLQVTGKELIELSFGNEPHSFAIRNFGGQDRKAIYRSVMNIQNADPQMRQAWSMYEDGFIKTRLNEKYTAMVKHGMFTTDLEASDDYTNKNRNANLQYVSLSLGSLDDKDVKVTDADIKAYYDKNIEEFRREESRSFEYVYFSIKAGQADSAAAQSDAMRMVEGLRTTTNDSAYVTGLGRRFDPTFKPRGSFPKEVEDMIFASDSGAVIGPQYVDGAYRIYKVVKTKRDTVNQYRASHILVRWKGVTKEDTAATIKEGQALLARVKGGEDFAAVAREKSEDGSASQGGDLGWWKKGAMVKEFQDAVERTSKGGITTAQSQFGYHVIKVTENPDNKLVQVAELDVPVKALSSTITQARNNVQRFVSLAEGGAKFDDAVKKMNLNKRVAENVKPGDFSIAGLENAREVIRWAFTPGLEVGTLSEAFKVGDNFVVAKLTSVNNEGYAPLEDIKEQVRTFAIQEKKKEMLSERIKDAMDKNKGNLEGIAKQLNASVNTAENVNFFQAFIPNLANQPALSGYAQGMKVNTVGGPVVGENAVFAVKVTSFSDIIVPKDLTQEKKMINNQSQSMAQSEYIEALRKRADVKDYRYLYSY